MSVLKTGVTIPVYKGGGKDPMDFQSYHGISLNSVISKILEILILDRLEPFFSGGGIPHPNQSAYRKGISCADAIFATEETLIHFLQEKCSVYMCLYDLQKAFDSVEVPACSPAASFRCWCVLQNMANSSELVYELLQCRTSRKSELIAIHPSAECTSRFDPLPLPLPFSDGSLLKQLQSASLGLSIHNTYAGGYLHADDIRTLACSYSSMETQIVMVSQFALDNFLTLNKSKSKCEVYSHYQCLST